jgi:hypothetical protein
VVAQLKKAAGSFGLTTGDIHQPENAVKKTKLSQHARVANNSMSLDRIDLNFIVILLCWTQARPVLIRVIAATR